MPRGHYARRRGPVASADVVGLRKAMEAYIDANVAPDDLEDGFLLRLFDIGEYMCRTGQASQKNPPRLRTISMNAEVLKMIAR